MKRYIRMVVDTQFCGTREEEYFETDMTDKELNDHGAEWAYENAQSYEYLVFGWGETAEGYAESMDISVEEAEEMMDNYYSEADYYWEEITKEEYLENIN